MNLRIRFAIWFAVFVTVILSVTFSIIYLQSAEFRREEFYDRLEQKARTTQRLLIDVDEISIDLLKIIDRNTLNTLYGEHVVVFNNRDSLIYDSDDTTPFDYDKVLLDDIRRDRLVRHHDAETRYETIGLLVSSPNHQTVVMASAYDIYGFRKLTNLRNILLITWVFGLGLSVVLAYLYVVHIVGKPLTRLTRQIASIGENDLTARITVPKKQNELTTLAANFNELLERLERAFDAQRGFVQYASHELRTPLANMLSETENTLSKDRSPETYRQTLQSLREEQSRLVELTNSLLLLSRYEKAYLSDQTPPLRIDEVLYNTIEEIRVMAPEYKVTLDFTGIPRHEDDLVIPGNEPLLRTAFRNLLENACRYADDQSAQIHIDSHRGQLEVWLDNRGAILSDAERSRLFTPFFRGSNATGRRGYGLGLVIARRIISIHGGVIEYRQIDAEINRFVVKFAKK